MRGKAVVIQSVLLLIVYLLFFGCSSSYVQSVNSYPIHNVDTGLSYPSIQAAINANQTVAGHTIFVEEGTYFENVELSKSNLTLIGENKRTTIIDGSSSGKTVVLLKGNYGRVQEFTLRCGEYGVAMDPWTRGHVICNNSITGNYYGVSGHYDCNNISICKNEIWSNNITGIKIAFSHSRICGNTISDNGNGKYKEYGSGMQITRGVMPPEGPTVYCVNNTIAGNTIRNHKIGIMVPHYSEHNLFVHNNFVNNEKQLSVTPDLWNNTAGENYWSDYEGGDATHDGLGDIPYIIDLHIHDSAPLMGMFYSFSAISEHYLHIISNSTIEGFRWCELNSTIRFYVSNSSNFQSIGFCRMAIPHSLIRAPYEATVNGAKPCYWNYSLKENDTHRWIYIAYEHSTLKVVIVPEFPITLMFLAFAAGMLVTVHLKKTQKRGSRRPRSQIDAI